MFGCPFTGTALITPRAALPWRCAPPRKTCSCCKRGAGLCAATNSPAFLCAFAAAQTRMQTRILWYPATPPLGYWLSAAQSPKSSKRTPNRPCAALWPPCSRGHVWSLARNRVSTPYLPSRPPAVASSTTAKPSGVPVIWASASCWMAPAAASGCSLSASVPHLTRTTGTARSGAICSTPAGHSPTRTTPT